MPKPVVIYSHKVRPQVLAAGLALLVSAFGFLTPWNPTSPTARAAEQNSVASGPQVQSARVAKPVNCSQVKCIALTFDDGPSALTPQFLDILDEKDANATFFVLGNRIAGNEEILRREYQRGDDIGNHTWDHPYITAISFDRVDSEIQATQEAIMRAGVPAPHLFRAPYGDASEAVMAHIPLTLVGWNIDPKDWNVAINEGIVGHIDTHAKPGGVIIMHDTEQNTLDHLPAIIDDLKAQGYTLVTVSDLLTLPPGQSGVFYGR